MSVVTGKFLSDRNRLASKLGWAFIVVAIVCGVILLFMLLGIDWEQGFTIPEQPRPLFQAMLVSTVSFVLLGSVVLAIGKSALQRAQTLSLRRENGSFTLETTHDKKIAVVARNLQWHELVVYDKFVQVNSQFDDKDNPKWTLQLRVWGLDRQIVFHEAFDGIMDSCIKAVNGEPHNADYISLEPGTLSRFAKLLCTTEPEKPAEVDLLGFGLGRDE